MSTDTWISSHCELNHLTDMAPSLSSSSSTISSPSLSSSSSSLFNINVMQQFSNVFNKFYSSEINSFISTKSNDSYLYTTNYLNQQVMNNYITKEQTLQDNHFNNVQEIFYKFLKIFPQFDLLQKSINHHETSSERSIQDLTINRNGQYDLNISDFNCSNTTLGTLPSPSEKSSPYDSSLCYQQMNHQMNDNEIDDSNDYHNKLSKEEKLQNSNEVNEFNYTLDHIKMNKTNSIYTTIPCDIGLSNIVNMNSNIRQDYRSPIENLTNHLPYQYENSLKYDHEQSNTEQYAINLSMKKTNLHQTIPSSQSEMIHHNTETNDHSLSNPVVYEYYTRLMQLSYIEWFRYLVCQSPQITGNSSTSSPIPHLIQNNNIYYSNNDKSCDFNSLNNVNNTFQSNHSSKDVQNIDRLTFHHSNEPLSINSDNLGSTYSSYDLSNFPCNLQSNFSLNNHQNALLNRLSTITSTTHSLPSYSPIRITKSGLQSMTKDVSKLTNICNMKSKSYSGNPIISKYSNTKSTDRTLIINGPNSYACKLCSKVYSQASALKMHVRTHTLPCRCTHCGKSFSRKWLLKGHERTHTGERPYSCSVCSRSFADRSNLRAHMQTHQREKRYSCPHCPRSFSRMGLLNKHMIQCTQNIESNNSITNRKSNNTMKLSNCYLPIKFS
ncbi:unnamed protein product [Schistosoma margrebowiei]|uniref:C2H2-type domain-containing protein n=1 Tax=Schistosoma margrebowiei TaxID=48269 RepID=A0AA84ZEE1_9TREM|nr:unnamed protein product [Schistosoma margrebowiei]